MFPEALFQDGSAEFPVDLACSTSILPPWMALWTMPRTEKTVARTLLDAECGYFLPVSRRDRVYPKSRSISTSPLFPGYLFAIDTPLAREIALGTGKICSLLEVHAQEQLWSDLRQIYSLMQSGAPLTLEEQLQPGMQAEIIAGPLKGRSGRVLRRGRELRLVIAVDFIRQGVSVEIQPTDLRAVV